ncbi:hypothetical protein JFK97_10815 [Chromobacterium phragmitis]|uniref:hypothetical protein n=1 Tax=Chromobacterium amazonense TaxID=1382803 RepID=UPI0021B72ED3|nr:hypothetical protein [Chromobacterium amazonense]MBM2884878.1 hypothetical protein [Chromobacterium amazonense]MDE1714777.1 hypothetical protein [Chromobacterium amazonense]
MTIQTEIIGQRTAPATEQTLRDFARETALMQLTLDDGTAITPGQLVQSALIHATETELRLNDPDSYAALLQLSARLLIANGDVQAMEIPQ